MGTRDQKDLFSYMILASKDKMFLEKTSDLENYL